MYSIHVLRVEDRAVCQSTNVAYIYITASTPPAHCTRRATYGDGGSKNNHTCYAPATHIARSAHVCKIYFLLYTAVATTNEKLLHLQYVRGKK